MHKPVILLLVALFALTGAKNASAEKRFALVIGNAAYEKQALVNPERDAALMSETLKSVGFEVTTLINADRITMRRAMLAFGRRLRGSSDVGLFYYAGHGVQVGGENFLIPIGSAIQDEFEVPIEGVSINEFLQTMQRSSSRINIVILDACRNNPYGSDKRSLARGLARVNAPSGTFVAYATSPGEIALDGDSGHSPYTKALSQAIVKPGQPLEQVFKEARRLVLKATGEQQVPWETSSITGQFYFTPPVEKKPETASTPAPQPTVSLELAYWNTIKDSGDPDQFDAYIQQYPNGTFTSLARIKRARLLEEAQQETEVAALPTKPQDQPLKPAGSEPGDKAPEPEAVEAEQQALVTDTDTDQDEQSKAISVEEVTSDDADDDAASETAEEEDPDLPRKLQQRLADAGCNPGTVDGIWGAKSEAALDRFADAADVEIPDEDVSAETLALLTKHSAVACPKATQQTVTRKRPQRKVRTKRQTTTTTVKRQRPVQRRKKTPLTGGHHLCKKVAALDPTVCN